MFAITKLFGELTLVIFIIEFVVIPFNQFNAEILFIAILFIAN